MSPVVAAAVRAATPAPAADDRVVVRNSVPIAFQVHTAVVALLPLPRLRHPARSGSLRCRQ